MKGTIFSLFFSLGFNPRTHEGYDINQTRLSEIDTILIPVPMKGTIWMSPEPLNFFDILIPVPTKGTMIIYYNWLWLAICFNPRTHEGYDLISTAINMVFQNFNPRAHEGYDFCLSYSIRYVTALIPVPVKGTIIALHILKNWQVF